MSHANNRLVRESVRSDELGVEPQESTRKLYEAIMDDRIEVPGPRTVSEVQDQSSPKNAARDAESGTVQPFEKEPSVDKRYATIVVMRHRRIGNRDDVNTPQFGEQDLAPTRAFRLSVQSIITRYGGVVNHTYAERVVAFLGGEQTRENDPDLALFATLEISKSATPEGHGAPVGASTGWVFLPIIGGRQRNKRRNVALYSVYDRRQCV